MVVVVLAEVLDVDVVTLSAVVSTLVAPKVVVEVLTIGEPV